MTVWGEYYFVGHKGGPLLLFKGTERVIWGSSRMLSWSHVRSCHGGLGPGREEKEK